MKKILLVSITSLAFLLPIVSFASIDLNLKYGSTGTEVKELQEFLISKGFLSGSATGNFFSLTNGAVIKYQGSLGLPTTGFVGPMTRAKINTELTTTTNTANQQEVVETGSVSAPSQNDKLTQLLNQIKALQAQLNTQTQTQQAIQTNTQQTVQNTTSVATAPSASTPTSVPPSPTTPTPTAPIVTTPPQANGPSVDIKANGLDGPVFIPEGQSVTISWTSQGTTDCGIDGQFMGWSGNWGTSGSKSAGPLRWYVNSPSNVAVIKCYAMIGNVLTKDAVSDSVTVNVTSPDALSNISGDNSSITITASLPFYALGGDLLVGTENSSNPAVDVTSFVVYKDGQVYTPQNLSFHVTGSGTTIPADNNNLKIAQNNTSTIVVSATLKTKDSNGNLLVPAGSYSAKIVNVKSSTQTFNIPTSVTSVTWNVR
jgi:hypothetical protein